MDPRGLRATTVDSNVNPTISRAEPLPGKVNYFIDDDPDKWVTNILTYAAVKMCILTSICVTTATSLNSNTTLSSLPVRIQQSSACFGQTNYLNLDANGDLLLTLPSGMVHQQASFTYQLVQGKQVEIPSRFVLLDEHEVGCVIDAYDQTRPLVIDPVLGYSTYLGGAFTMEEWASR